MRNNRFLAAGAATLMLAAAPFFASALDIDHKHGRDEHHGGEIGQAIGPSTNHAVGVAGLDRVRHRHVAIPEGDHYGHREVIHPSCSGTKVVRKTTRTVKSACRQGPRAATHASAAERGDAVADERDCCDEVYVSIPAGYQGRSGWGYYDEAEVQMDYVFHHLTREALARNQKKLEAQGLIPAGSGFKSKVLVKTTVTETTRYVPTEEASADLK